MSTLRLNVQTMTPLLMYGADNKSPAYPELRGASMRGLLRYWLRAVLGTQHRSSSDLYAAESNILGSTEQGSKVSVRVVPRRSLEDVGDLIVMPESTCGRPLRHDGFAPGGDFRITLSTHPLDNSDILSGDLLKAVYLLVHFGGMGKRARRGSGNLRVLDAKGLDNDPPLAFTPDNGEHLVQYLREVCRYISPEATTVGRRPNHPVFAYDTAAVLVDHVRYDSYDEAFDRLWRVSGPYHSDGGIFGDVRPRRASAIHMRVSGSKHGFHPQITVMYSGSGNWDRMKHFIESCRADDFAHVYGDWSDWK